MRPASPATRRATPKSVAENRAAKPIIPKPDTTRERAGQTAQVATPGTTRSPSPLRPTARLPGLDSLKVFEAAARHLSFTSAATELSVTQSAVSRQVKSLEGALGVALFSRDNRRLELTEAGARLSRGAARALADLHTVLNEVRGTAPGAAAPVLTVTTTISFASLWLVPRLADFRARHPGIDLRLAANDNVVALERERIDCAIRFCEPAEAPAGAVPLMREVAYPVVSPRLLRDRARPLRTPADLRHHVLLKFDDPQRLLPWVEWPRWLAGWQLQDFAPAGWLTFSHYDQVINAAAEGEGVAIGRHALAQRLIAQKKLVVPFGERVYGPHQYFLILSRAARARPELKAFVEWVQGQAADDAA